MRAYAAVEEHYANAVRLAFHDATSKRHRD